MKIKKVSADAVKLHELTPVKLKTAGNTLVGNMRTLINKSIRMCKNVQYTLDIL